MLQRILESYQRYPNPEIDDAEALANLRATELAFLRRELDQFFDDAEDLQLLAESIREIAAQLNLSGSIGSLLCPLEAGDPQQRAYEQIFLRALGQTSDKARRKKQITNDMLDYCSQIVGWIAISFVNDQWIKQHRVGISDRDNPTPTTLRLSDKQGDLIELVVARSHKRLAGFEKSGEAEIVSRFGVILDEPGSVGATLMFVFQKLMIKFMPDRDFNEMTDDHWEELDTRIKAQRLDQNLFIAFKSRESWQEVAKQLSDKLQCLPQFWFYADEQGGTLLLLTGPRIMGLIAESIRKIEDYRKHAKSN